MDLECQVYLNKKLGQVDSKAHSHSKIHMCMALKDYYERFCDRRDNPTFNLIEVELKREIYGIINDSAFQNNIQGDS